MNLPSGKVTADLRKTLIAAVEHMSEQGAEGLILGSTDLGFAVTKEDVRLKLFDTNLLHATGVARWSLESK